MELRLAVFRPFGKDMSHRYVGDNIIPPFITCPVGLYMNGELARLQSGGLNLKTSMLRSCNTWLQMIVVAIGVE